MFFHLGIPPYARTLCLLRRNACECFGFHDRYHDAGSFNITNYFANHGRTHDEPVIIRTSRTSSDSGPNFFHSLIPVYKVLKLSFVLRVSYRTRCQSSTWLHSEKILGMSSYNNRLETGIISLSGYPDDVWRCVEE